MWLGHGAGSADPRSNACASAVLAAVSALVDEPASDLCQWAKVAIHDYQQQPGRELMAFWSTLFGAGIASPIEAIGKVVDEVHTSEEERAAAKIVMERLRQEPGKLQSAINMVEAQHRSVWVAGWRPAVGWLCVAALSYLWIVRPVFNDMLTLVGFPLPDLDIGAADVILLLGPLLGLGTLRTGEKLAGRAK